MTTIAIDREILTVAAESRTCEGEIFYDNTTKVWRVNGKLVGGCGCPEGMTAFRDAIRKYQEPQLDKDTSCFVLHPDGLLQVYSRRGYVDHEDRFLAMGSGSQVALAALRSGIDPKKAVEMAITVDPNSGGRVRKWTLKKSS